MRMKGVSAIIILFTYFWVYEFYGNEGRLSYFCFVSHTSGNLNSMKVKGITARIIFFTDVWAKNFYDK